MNDLFIKSSSHSYHIYIRENIRFNVNELLAKTYSSILIITDENVAPLYLEDVKESLPSERVYTTIIPATERSKGIQTYYQVHTEAIQYGLDRESLIIALGGGVVGDLAGFVAATYMRGIDYIQMPTTILAHDSSVGGKVAINHELGKNLIGNFYPPVAVVYDVQVLETVSEKEVRSGYAELIKEALIADESFFKSIMDTSLTSLTNEQLTTHIRQGIAIKATIVEQDEREANTRKYLNLGHTLGHAIESELGYGSITHGEAVAIGMLFAMRVSEQKYFIKLPDQELLEWLQNNNYPLQLGSINTNNLLNRMKSDKKAVSGKLQMVLLKDVGVPVIEEVSEDDLNLYLSSFTDELLNS
ncbi:3-dehydroquinate synthase [Virgibacillus byunsanensis]|uniref:3-dehydroquinate synthase n=1 Tax=Virgibacillus byunsanensis TaxID=570945 RepID=A0ABW3LMP2_9BACI